MCRSDLSVSDFLKPIGFFLCLVLAGWAFGQKNKTQLEQEKRENLKRIAEAEKILTDTERERKVTLGQLQAINQQISAREGLINSLNEEIGLLDGEIQTLSIVVNALQADLKHLKEEYARMIYAGYKTSRGYGTLTFLFSAKTFNQLFMRLKYLEQYAEARKNQAQQIEEVSRELADQRNKVEIKRTEQRTLLNQQMAENRKLTQLKNKQAEVAQELSKKEKELRAELNERKQAVERLDNLIAEIVRKELERSKSMSSAAVASSESVTTSFESNKNKLDWPVASGFISSKFGKQSHPVMKGIVVDNPGVDIQTNENTEVRCVHEGVVTAVAYVEGMNNVVIMKHGDYFTMYARLKSVSVKKGSKVGKNEPIGQVFTDRNGVSEVHFEVWKNYTKLNPEQWLSPK